MYRSLSLEKEREVQVHLYPCTAPRARVIAVIIPFQQNATRHPSTQSENGGERGSMSSAALPLLLALTALFRHGRPRLSPSRSLFALHPVERERERGEGDGKRQSPQQEPQAISISPIRAANIERIRQIDSTANNKSENLRKKKTEMKFRSCMARQKDAAHAPINKRWQL